MNADTARQHLSRLPADDVTPVDSPSPLVRQPGEGPPALTDVGNTPEEIAFAHAFQARQRLTVLTSHRAVFVGRGNGGEYWCRCGQWFLTPDLLVGHLSDQVEAPFGTESTPGGAS